MQQEVTGFTVSSMKDQKVLVLGLGASGLAMAKWCVRNGASVMVADTREAPPQLAALQELGEKVSFASGAFTSQLVAGTDIRAVFVSPGLSPAQTEPVVAAATSIGLTVGGELSLFAQALRDLQETTGYAPRILAVTGTNGKTTVTSLCAHLLKWADKKVALAGNIGPTLLDTLSEALDANELADIWALELSSFQLHFASGFEPTAATVLNISQDHLDWHGDMQAYASDKARIFGEQGLMVLNRDDSAVMAMQPAPQKGKEARKVVTFGSNMPQRAGDFGLEDVNGMVWLVRAHEADETRKKPRSAQEEELYFQRLMPADALRIRGRHNACNALAALALCMAAGCALAPILYGLREYRGEPHRVESVAIVDEVEYFDDSKGTNVGATLAALNGLGAQRRLVLILGGDGKGQDFSPLAEAVSRYVRAVALIGRDAAILRVALQDCAVPLLDAGSMQEAVAICARHAHAGDAVLMSPACASLDMYDNYAHRARVFCEAVDALAEDAGNVGAISGEVSSGLTGGAA